MKKYVCEICGYIYDEAAGDPEHGIAPGTKWEDLPEDFECRSAASARTSLSWRIKSICRDVKGGAL